MRQKPISDSNPSQTQTGIRITYVLVDRQTNIRRSGSKDYHTAEQQDALQRFLAENEANNFVENIHISPIYGEKQLING